MRASAGYPTGRNNDDPGRTTRTKERCLSMAKATSGESGTPGTSALGISVGGAPDVTFAADHEVVTEFPDLERSAVLTPRQRKVLEYIRDSVARRGYPPSVREIGEAVGLKSPSSVAHQLGALQKKGY